MDDIIFLREDYEFYLVNDDLCCWDFSTNHDNYLYSPNIVESEVFGLVAKSCIFRNWIFI